MKVSIKGFIYHKTAERYADCFDRFGVNIKTNKFAVSDGVSKSFFPGIWAQLLVDSFANTEGKINLTDSDLLKALQNKWINMVAEIVNRPNQKYFVRNLFAQGRSAAATFVGLYFFKEGGKYSWQAYAIGDSFLFFVPDYIKDISSKFEKDVVHLSSKKDFEFDNFPDFFDSRDRVPKGRIEKEKRELTPGTFYLMTDALSEWFISERQNAKDEINSWKNQANFERSIRRLRNNTLQNDDVAILIIQVENDNKIEINYENVLITDFNKLLEIEKKVYEKQEIELKEFEKQLIKKYEDEKLEDEKRLLRRYEIEKLEAKNKLIRKQQNEKLEAIQQFRRRQELEKEEFENRLERRQELEKIEVEKQLERKLESEKAEINKQLDRKFEDWKSKKSKEIAEKYEVRENSHEETVNKEDSYIKQEEQSITQTLNAKDENIEANKQKNIVIYRKPSDEKGNLRKKKKFWENLFHSNDEVENEEKEREQFPDKKNEAKKKSDRNRDNKDDVSSITDKF